MSGIQASSAYIRKKPSYPSVFGGRFFIVYNTIAGVRDKPAGRPPRVLLRANQQCLQAAVLELAKVDASPIRTERLQAARAAALYPYTDFYYLNPMGAVFTAVLPPDRRLPSRFGVRS